MGQLTESDLRATNGPQIGLTTFQVGRGIVMMSDVAPKLLKYKIYLKSIVKFDNFYSVSGNKGENRIAFLTMA